MGEGELEAVEERGGVREARRVEERLEQPHHLGDRAAVLALERLVGQPGDGGEGERGGPLRPTAEDGAAEDGRALEEGAQAAAHRRERHRRAAEAFDAGVEAAVVVEGLDVLEVPRRAVVAEAVRDDVLAVVAVVRAARRAAAVHHRRHPVRVVARLGARRLRVEVARRRARRERRVVEQEVVRVGEDARRELGGDHALVVAQRLGHHPEHVLEEAADPIRQHRVRDADPQHHRQQPRQRRPQHVLLLLFGEPPVRPAVDDAAEAVDVRLELGVARAERLLDLVELRLELHVVVIVGLVVVGRHLVAIRRALRDVLVPRRAVVRCHAVGRVVRWRRPQDCRVGGGRESAQARLRSLRGTSKR